MVLFKILYLVSLVMNNLINCILVLNHNSNNYFKHYCIWSILLLLIEINALFLMFFKTENCSLGLIKKDGQYSVMLIKDTQQKRWLNNS